MATDWQDSLNRWVSAGVVDAPTADRVRDWEKQHGKDAGRSRFALLAFAFGGLLLIAGVLLFVASNWQSVSPGGRFTLLLATVAAFHVGASFGAKLSDGLATTFHAIGTGALGGGIFLSGQTFNLAESWPGAFGLWALGAAAGLYFLRDWPHVLLTAVLTPVWLLSEWADYSFLRNSPAMVRPAASGALLLAFAYICAVTASSRASWREILARLGAVAVIPAAIVLGSQGAWDMGFDPEPVSGVANSLAWVVAIALPLGLALVLRGSAAAQQKDAVFMLAPLLWVLAIGQIDAGSDPQFLLLIGLYVLGSVGLVVWGLRQRYPLFVNIGVIGFFLSILAFYFASSLFDKLGRSLGLIGAGLLFIGAGLLLERTRRKIIGQIDEAQAEAATP